MILDGAAHAQTGVMRTTQKKRWLVLLEMFSFLP